MKESFRPLNDIEIKSVRDIVPFSNRNFFRKDMIFLKYVGVQYSIRKFDDEWYTVMVTTSPSEEKLASAAYTANDFSFEYYKCDQLEGLLLFINDRILKNINEGYSMDSDEIQDYFLEYSDKGTDDFKVIESTQQELDTEWESKYKWPNYPVFVNSIKVDRFAKNIDEYDFKNSDQVTYLKIQIMQPKGRVRGNLDVNGYTISTISHYLKKLTRHRKVNVFLKVIDYNLFGDILSTSIVKISFLN